MTRKSYELRREFAYSGRVATPESGDHPSSIQSIKPA